MILAGRGLAVASVAISPAPFRGVLPLPIPALRTASDFLPFKNLEQSVRDDVTFLRESPLIPKSISISGFIYDVESGRLHPVS